MKSTAHICLVLIVISIAGCAIESRQLDTLTRQFFEKKTVPKTTQWVAIFMGGRTVLQPLIGEGKILFVNDQSDYVEFDGWSIRQVGGFDQFNKPLRIIDVGGERRFVVAGRIRAIHQCGPWASREIADGVKFEQVCKGAQAYTNSILVDSLGRIVRIEQHTGKSSKAFILQLIG
jgi:hypothetical protein